ncbi:hypothetical protein WJX74_001918 [Apatococcus lobatus]|uniref:Tyrosine specific protein phosphatases domain-containing protein n=1 Tax=Apatococcus lobatus TaxID=904363 RepID=A0AAW1RFV2_9CHLO
MSAQNPRVKTLKANGETLTRAATARDGELVVETVPLQRAHSATDKDPRQRFWGSFTKGQKGSQRQLNQAALQVAPAIAVNLRDIGKVSDIVKSGILFRSSELISAQEVQRYNVQTVVDLRRMDRPCKQSVNVHERRLRKLWHDIRMVIPEDKKPYAARGMPNACSSCSERFSERHEHTCEVMHADFIPGRVGLHIFQAMPASIRCQAILAALTGKGAASVMAPAVANPAYMGYKVLYKTVLDKSKRGIAKAIRVLRDSRNFPVLVHCIHGKDRTGLLVMLILLLCNIPPSEIVKDYMLSETVLKESRMHQELHLDTYLTSDDVIAATRDCMEDTITYVNGKLGGINAYLKTCGLEEWELSQIRVNLLAQAAPKDLLERLRRSSAFARQSQVGDRLGASGGLFGRKSKVARSDLHRRSDPTSARHATAEENGDISHRRVSVDSSHMQRGSSPDDPSASFSSIPAPTISPAQAAQIGQSSI